jgi:hypothetical protein
MGRQARMKRTNRRKAGRKPFRLTRRQIRTAADWQRHHRHGRRTEIPGGWRFVGGMFRKTNAGERLENAHRFKIPRQMGKRQRKKLVWHDFFGISFATIPALRARDSPHVNEILVVELESSVARSHGRLRCASSPTACSKPDRESRWSARRSWRACRLRACFRP